MNNKERQRVAEVTQALIGWQVGDLCHIWPMEDCSFGGITRDSIGALCKVVDFSSKGSVLRTKDNHGIWHVTTLHKDQPHLLWSVHRARITRPDEDPPPFPENQTAILRVEWRKKE